MRKILLVSAFLLVGKIVFCQDLPDGTGSYSESENDYKHIKKNESGKKEKKKSSVVIHSKKIKEKNNYKQTFSKPEEKEKAIINTKKNKSKKSYKHSYGL